MRTACIVAIFLVVMTFDLSRAQYGYRGWGNDGRVRQDAAIGAELGALAGAASGNPWVEAQDAAIGANIGASVGESGWRRG